MRADCVRITLEEEDHSHPIVQQRLRASKVATLATPIVTTKSDPGKTMRTIVETFAEHAMRHLDTGARRLAVIVNRVAVARQIHEDLKDRAGEQADVVLLTGRMRPLDRDEVLGAVSDRIIAGTQRTAERRPVVVVSTQTIEAGADFDFDALVTECASLDALRQRFGRLDRRGELKKTRATILVRKDQATDSKDDPVYGPALGKTWSWLLANATESLEIDFGIAHFTSLPSAFEARAELCSPLQHAPVLLPAHLDAWAQTQPRGEPDPDVSLWLHGPERGTAEVRVVWRADIADALAVETGGDASVEEYASSSLAAAPPSSLESISVPLPAFRSWIGSEQGVDLADVEGVEAALASGATEREDDRKVRPFLIVTKSGATVHRNTKGLYPEATIVVPNTYGGIRDGNWSPDTTEPVRDLGDLAQLLHRGRPVLRLVPSVLCPALAKAPRGEPASIISLDDTRDASAERVLSGLELSEAEARTVLTASVIDEKQLEPRDAFRTWLDSTRSAGSELWGAVVEEVLGRGSRLRVVELGTSGFFAVLGQRRKASKLEAFRKQLDITSDVIVDDDDSASYVGREVSLQQHLGEVEHWARLFASNLRLPDALSRDLALAAHLHDIGKADPRFQQMLHGGSPVRMAASAELLAKSRGDARDRAARKQAAERARYPMGYRHELLSVAMLQRGSQGLERAGDPDLVLHLVGSHHGWCRPFAPAVDVGKSMLVEFSLDGMHFSGDTAHGLTALDSGIADRYWLLTERYGWWTLAWLEALLRLADHRASEEGSSGDSNRPGSALETT
jgi:CRISPR-associated endonuclease/helicase Cas3